MWGFSESSKIDKLSSRRFSIFLFISYVEYNELPKGWPNHCRLNTCIEWAYAGDCDAYWKDLNDKHYCNAPATYATGQVKDHCKASCNNRGRYILYQY